MNIDKDDTAVVFIDPQNEVLSEKGLAWPLVHESLRENNTIENMERIFKAAKALGFEVFISPHYFYPTDKGWKFNGPLEADEATSGMFARKGVLNLDGLEGSGADWLERFKPYIEDGKTIVVSPHAAAQASLHSPRAITGWFVTSTASKPLLFKLRTAWAAPGSNSIWPGSEIQFTSRFKVPSRSRNTARCGDAKLLRAMTPAANSALMRS